MKLNTLFDNGSHKIESAGTLATPLPETKITKLSFKQRMTAGERISVRAAAQNDPIVFDFIDLVDSANFIDLASQDTIDGVNYLELQGLIDTGRSNEILTSPIKTDEKY